MKIAFVGRMKNGHLYKLLKDKGWSQADLARFLGVSYMSVSSWMLLKAAPKDEKTLAALEQLTWTPREELFPEKELKTAKGLPREIASIQDVDIKDIYLAMMGGRDKTLSLEQEFEISEAQETVRNALKILAPREKLVIAKRFGLNDDSEQQSFDEIASHLSLSRERIRQIERRALRKLVNRKNFEQLKEASKTMKMARLA